MTNVFIFHGTTGHPEENWFPWLRKELESLDCKVIIPQFPTPENQTLENWFKVFEKHQDLYVPDTILVGHSLGGAFSLRVLEKYNIVLKAAYFVATPVGIRPIKNWETDQPYIGHPFNWSRITSHARKFYVFHSDNDPYVGIGNGEELARKLDVKLTFIPNAGHFNAVAGYTRFELLLDKIKLEL